MRIVLRAWLKTVGDRKTFRWKKSWVAFLTLIHSAGNIKWGMGVKTRVVSWDSCSKSEFLLYAIFTFLCNPSPSHHVITISAAPNNFPLFQPLQLSRIILFLYHSLTPIQASPGATHPQWNQCHYPAVNGSSHRISRTSTQARLAQLWWQPFANT